MPYYLATTEDATTADTSHAFDTRAEAFSAVTVDYPKVVFIPAYGETGNFRQRERAHFASGDYLPVPWANDDWAQSYALQDHYAHISLTQPGSIAFTESVEKGVQDKQLCIRPGRYLERFAPHLSAAERDDYCARCKASLHQSILWAVTPDEIEHVYRNGPCSCMSHHASDYRSEVHPTRAYGNSDLRLAYIQTGHDNRIVARSLVWESRQVHTRVYGDTTLTHLLHTAGYAYQAEFYGARIRAIETSRGGFVVPYLDCGNALELLDSMLVITRDGGISGSSTDGISADEEEEERYTCCGADDCENDVDGEGERCDTCRDNYTCCEYCDNGTYDADDFTHIDNYGSVCTPCANDLAHCCTICDETFYEQQYRSHVQRARRGTDYIETVCEDCRDNGAHACTRTDRYGVTIWHDDTDAVILCGTCTPKRAVWVYRHTVLSFRVTA